MAQNNTSTVTVTGSEETHLIDSLLHTNMKRVVVGAICGVVSGLLLLLLSNLFTPVGANKIWWLQLMASMLYGGEALALQPSSNILVAGLIVHFGLSIIDGLIFGKMTTSRVAHRLAGYGLVLGGLCWLASNMFAPDLLSIDGLATVGQWTRMFLFVSFGMSLGLFMSIASNVLDL